MAVRPYHGPEMLEMLSNMVAAVARIEERVNTVVAITEDLNNTVHGKNGDVGLVAKVDAINKEVSRLEEDRKQMRDLAKEHEDLKRRVEDYPSYTWLLKNKTKSTIAMTITVASLLIVLVAPLFDPATDLILYRVLVAFLKVNGIPVLLP